MTQRYFVTASGTDIGKTHVTAVLCRQLRAQGKKVRCLKPIMSGFNFKDVGMSDAGVLLTATGQSTSIQNVEAMSPWRFEPAISPDMAAAREGVEINLDQVVAFCQSEPDEDVDALFIEGAGGVMAPINESSLMVDLISGLEIPTLVVVGSYLGTISHTLTAIELLKSRDIPIQGVVVCESEESPVPLEETVATMGRFARGTTFAALPRCDLTDWRSAPDLTRLFP